MLKLLLTKCQTPSSRQAGWQVWTGGTRAERVLGLCGGDEQISLFWFLRQSLTKKLKDWNELTIPQLLSDRFKVSSIIAGSTRRFLVFGLLERLKSTEDTFNLHETVLRCKHFYNLSLDMFDQRRLTCMW